MRHAPLVVAALWLGLSGCFFLTPEDTSLVSFPVVRTLPEQTIEGSLLGGLLGSLLGIPVDLELDLEEETRARDTGPAQHVYLTELRLQITATAEPGSDQDDFDFLDSIEVFVESRAPDTTLPRRRVAYLDTVPDGARSVALMLEDVDLIRYVNEGARLTASADGRQPLDDTTFDGRLELVVEVL